MSLSVFYLYNKHTVHGRQTDRKVKVGVDFIKVKLTKDLSS